MKHLADQVWLDESHYCVVEELAELSGLSVDDIEDLIDNGVIAPIASAEARSFRASAILIVQTARRLRDDFQLDQSGLTLALTLLRRIAELEAEISRRKATSA